MSRQNRYSTEARQVLSYAREEAVRLRYKIIGTEHLLLGLFKMKDPIIEGVFTYLHVSTFRICQALEFVVGSGSKALVSEPTFGPAARAALLRAELEAAQQQAELVSLEHLLLGLLSERGGGSNWCPGEFWRISR